MALFPKICTVMLLDTLQQKTARAITPDVIVLHTNGGPGSGPGLWNYWKNPPSDIFSHFQVDADGKAYQYQDTSLEAPAEYAGNLRGISIETQDNGNPDTPWTLAQVEKIAEICHAVSVAHGIPLKLMRVENDAGVGYHQMWPDWNRSGHNCPGPVRVAQIELVLSKANHLGDDEVALTYITHDGGKEPRLLSPEARVGAILGPQGASAMKGAVAVGLAKVYDLDPTAYNGFVSNGSL